MGMQYKQTIKAQKTSLANAKSQIPVLTKAAKCSSFKARLGAVGKTLASCQKAEKKKAVSVARLRSSNDRLRDKNASLMSQIRALIKANKHHKAAAKCVEHRAEIRKVKQQLRRKDMQIRRLRKEVASSGASLETARGDLAKTRAALKSARSQRASLQKQLEAATKSHGKLVKQIAFLSKQINGLSVAKRQLEQKWKSLRAKIAAARTRVERLRKSLNKEGADKNKISKQLKQAVAHLIS